MITDQEFKFSDLFPMGSHLFCWNHLVNDLRWYVRKNCNCTAEEEVNTSTQLPSVN